MREEYIKLAMARFAATDEFDKIFTNRWILDENYQDISHTAIMASFKAFDIAVDPSRYEDEFHDIFSALAEQNAIIYEGDEFTERWFKLIPNTKKIALAGIIKNNPVSGRVTKLGSPALIRALRKIVEQDESSAEQTEPLENEGPPEKSEVPAADRLVTIDHNRPEHNEIAKAFDDAIEVALNTKPNKVSGDEHASLIKALEAARTLWQSFELTYIQIKVGIIMAVERAEKALKINFQLVRGPLLMEAIKGFFRAAKNGDLF